MKKQRVIIVHGWDGSPNEPMLKWLKNNLEDSFEVIVPNMPNPAEPKIKDWVDKLKEVAGNIDENTFFVGHSIGCQAVLRFLQTINQKAKGIVLIAPWINLDMKTIEEEGEEVKEIAKPWMETSINWKKIKNNIGKAVCIFSDNDCYVPLSDANIFKEKLNAEIIIEHNKGHFDPSSGVRDNPAALDKILEIIGK